MIDRPLSLSRSRFYIHAFKLLIKKKGKLSLKNAAISYEDHLCTVYKISGCEEIISFKTKDTELILKYMRSEGCPVSKKFLKRPRMLTEDIIFIDKDNVYKKEFLEDNWVDAGDQDLYFSNSNLDFIPLIKTKGYYMLDKNNIKSLEKYTHSVKANLSFNGIKVIPDFFNLEKFCTDIRENPLVSVPDHLYDSIKFKEIFDKYSIKKSGQNGDIIISGKCEKDITFNHDHKELCKLNRGFD